MATRKQILDNNNNEILPITDTDAVRNPQSIGGTLESRISNIEKAIEDSDLLVEQNSLTDQQRNIALANVSNQTANSTTGKMGYKVLDPTKTFAEQVTAENTIYEIRDVFDLSENTTFILPANVVLKFVGGSINNGTLKAATNSYFNIDYISGGGLHCNLSNNDFSEVRLSWFGVNENSNSEYNHKVIQNIVNLTSKTDTYSTYDSMKSMPLLVVDVPKVVIDGVIHVRRTLNITSDINTKYNHGITPILQFIGETDGFIWDNSEYSPFNNISNLYVKSYGYCFNIGDDQAGCNSFYKSSFINIAALSTNQSCISARYSSSGRVFSCRIEDCMFLAPNGYCIEGFQSIDCIFTNLKTLSNGNEMSCLSVLHNCTGTLRDTNIGDDNINHIWDFDSNFTTGYSRNVYIENCNLENINREILYGKSLSNTSFNVVIKGTNIIYKSGSGTKFPDGVQLYPIDLDKINKLEVYCGNNVFALQITPEYRFARTINNDTTTVIFKSDVPNITMLHGTIELLSSIKSETNIVYEGNKISFDDYRTVGMDYLNTSKIGFRKNTIEAQSAINVMGNVYNEITASANTAISSFICYNADAPTNFNYPFICYIKNVSDYNITIKKYIQGINNGVFSKLNKDIVLTKNQWIIIVFTAKTASFLLSCSKDRVLRAGSSTDRPDVSGDNYYLGYQYFDETLGKYICWNGTSWVNLDGTALS